MTFHYRESVKHQLTRHGLSPDGSVAPEQLREQLNEIYVREIRKLREGMVAGEIPKSQYSTRVAELRDQYPLLGLPLQMWTIADESTREESKAPKKD